MLRLLRGGPCVRSSSPKITSRWQCVSTRTARHGRRGGGDVRRRSRVARASFDTWMHRRRARARDPRRTGAGAPESAAPAWRWTRPTPRAAPTRRAEAQMTRMSSRAGCARAKTRHRALLKTATPDVSDLSEHVRKKSRFIVAAWRLRASSAPLIDWLRLRVPALLLLRRLRRAREPSRALSTQGPPRRSSRCCRTRGGRGDAPAAQGSPPRLPGSPRASSPAPATAGSHRRAGCSSRPLGRVRVRGRGLSSGRRRPAPWARHGARMWAPRARRRRGRGGADLAELRRAPRAPRPRHGARAGGARRLGAWVRRALGGRARVAGLAGGAALRPAVASRGPASAAPPLTPHPTPTFSVVADFVRRGGERTPRARRASGAARRTVRPARDDGRCAQKCGRARRRRRAAAWRVALSRACSRRRGLDALRGRLLQRRASASPGERRQTRARGHRASKWHPGGGGRARVGGATARRLRPRRRRARGDNDHRAGPRAARPGACAPPQQVRRLAALGCRARRAGQRCSPRGGRSARRRGATPPRPRDVCLVVASRGRSASTTAPADVGGAVERSSAARRCALERGASAAPRAARPSGEYACARPSLQSGRSEAVSRTRAASRVVRAHRARAPGARGPGAGRRPPSPLALSAASASAARPGAERRRAGGAAADASRLTARAPAACAPAAAARGRADESRLRRTRPRLVPARGPAALGRPTRRRRRLGGGVDVANGDRRRTRRCWAAAVASEDAFAGPRSSAPPPLAAASGAGRSATAAGSQRRRGSRRRSAPTSAGVTTPSRYARSERPAPPRRAKVSRRRDGAGQRRPLRRLQRDRHDASIRMRSVTLVARRLATGPPARRFARAAATGCGDAPPSADASVPTRSGAPTGRHRRRGARWTRSALRRDAGLRSRVAQRGGTWSDAPAVSARPEAPRPAATVMQVGLAGWRSTAPTAKAQPRRVSPGATACRQRAGARAAMARAARPRRAVVRQGTGDAPTCEADRRRRLRRPAWLRRPRPPPSAGARDFAQRAASHAPGCRVSPGTCAPLAASNGLARARVSWPRARRRPLPRKPLGGARRRAAGHPPGTSSYAASSARRARRRLGVERPATPTPGARSRRHDRARCRPPRREGAADAASSSAARGLELGGVVARHRPWRGRRCSTSASHDLGPSAVRAPSRRAAASGVPRARRRRGDAAAAPAPMRRSPCARPRSTAGLREAQPPACRLGGRAREHPEHLRPGVRHARRTRALGGVGPRLANRCRARWHLGARRRGVLRSFPFGRGDRAAAAAAFGAAFLVCLDCSRFLPASLRTVASSTSIDAASVFSRIEAFPVAVAPRPRASSSSRAVSSSSPPRRAPTWAARASSPRPPVAAPRRAKNFPARVPPSDPPSDANPAPPVETGDFRRPFAVGGPSIVARTGSARWGRRRAAPRSRAGTRAAFSRTRANDARSARLGAERRDVRPGRAADLRARYFPACRGPARSFLATGSGRRLDARPGYMHCDRRGSAEQRLRSRGARPQAAARPRPRSAARQRLLTAGAFPRPSRRPRIRRAPPRPESSSSALRVDQAPRHRRPRPAARLRRIRRRRALALANLGDCPRGAHERFATSRARTSQSRRSPRKR